MYISGGETLMGMCPMRGFSLKCCESLTGPMREYFQKYCLSLAGPITALMIPM